MVVVFEFIIIPYTFFCINTKLILKQGEYKMTILPLEIVWLQERENKALCFVYVV